MFAFSSNRIRAIKRCWNSWFSSWTRPSSTQHDFLLVIVFKINAPVYYHPCRYLPPFLSRPTLSLSPFLSTCRAATCLFLPYTHMPMLVCIYINRLIICLRNKKLEFPVRHVCFWGSTTRKIRSNLCTISPSWKAFHSSKIKSFSSLITFFNATYYY